MGCCCGLEEKQRRPRDEVALVAGDVTTGEDDGEQGRARAGEALLLQGLGLGCDGAAARSLIDGDSFRWWLARGAAGSSGVGARAEELGGDCPTGLWVPARWIWEDPEVEEEWVVGWRRREGWDNSPQI